MSDDQLFDIKFSEAARKLYEEIKTAEDHAIGLRIANAVRRGLRGMDWEIDQGTDYREGERYLRIEFDLFTDIGSYTLAGPHFFNTAQVSFEIRLEYLTDAVYWIYLHHSVTRAFIMQFRANFEFDEGMFTWRFHSYDPFNDTRDRALHLLTYALLGI